MRADSVADRFTSWLQQGMCIVIPSLNVIHGMVGMHYSPVAVHVEPNGFVELQTTV